MLLVGLMTMGFQAWSWFLGVLMSLLSLAKAADSTMKSAGAPNWLRGVTTGGYGAYTMNEEEKAAAARAEAEEAAREAQRFNAPYQRSEYMPNRDSSDHMARYAPQNRQPQSGVSPDIMAYLRRYVR